MPAKPGQRRHSARHAPYKARAEYAEDEISESAPDDVGSMHDRCLSIQCPRSGRTPSLSRMRLSGLRPRCGLRRVRWIGRNHDLPMLPVGARFRRRPWSLPKGCQGWHRRFVASLSRCVGPGFALARTICRQAISLGRRAATGPSFRACAGHPLADLECSRQRPLGLRRRPSVRVLDTFPAPPVDRRVDLSHTDTRPIRRKSRNRQTQP